MTGQEKKCTRVEEEKEEGRYGEEEEDHYYHQSKIPKKNYFFFKTPQIAPPFQKRVQWIESLDNFFLNLSFTNNYLRKS